MSGYSTSISAYPDIIEVLDRAMQSERGIRLTFDTPTEAMRFKQRVHSFRYHDRRTNTKTYPDDHPLHGKTPYEILSLRSPSPVEVIVERLDVKEYRVEEL